MALLALLPACGGEEQPQCLTVSELDAQAGPMHLVGTTVTICGEPELNGSLGLVACDPQRCDCNFGSSTLSFDTEAHSASVDIDIQGGADECTIRVSPVNPLTGRGLQVTGVLSAGSISHRYRLSPDWSASRSLPDFDGTLPSTSAPLEQGTFACACEGKANWRNGGCGGKEWSCVPQ